MKKILTLLFISYSCYINAAPYEYGDISDEEQLNIEYTNQARAHPFNEAAKLMLDINEGLLPGTITNTPKQPLVSNSTLYKAAKDHCLDMMNTGVWSHTSADGREFYTRIYDAGWTGGYNIAENISSTGDGIWSYELFFIDKGVESKGHRLTMLNDQMNSIGVGSCEYLVQDYGDDGNIYVTGVVYNDINNDKLYSSGEGIGSVKIQIGNSSTLSGKAGGYAIKATSGTYDVIFTHPTSGSITKKVVVSNKNVKIDAILSDFTGTTTPVIPMNCSIYNMQTYVVSLPCVSVDNVNYKAELQNIGNETFKIKSAEVLK